MKRRRRAADLRGHPPSARSTPPRDGRSPVDPETTEELERARTAFWLPAVVPAAQPWTEPSREAPRRSAPTTEGQIASQLRARDPMEIGRRLRSHRATDP